jgi:hypothetical protein
MVRRWSAATAAAVTSARRDTTARAPGKGGANQSFTLNAVN